MQKTLFFFLTLPTLLLSCGGRNNPNVSLSDHIAGMRQASGQRPGGARAAEWIATVFPGPRSEFRQGDTIRIGYTPVSDTLRLDSVVLSLNERRVGRIDGGEWLYVSGANDPLGRIAYRIAAWRGADSTARTGEFTLMAAKAPTVYGYREIAWRPHDPTAYTQGLYWQDGYLYEGTGLEGHSSLRKVDPETGAVLRKIDLDPRYFGEGIALLDGKIYQLTWQHGLGFIYDAQTFRQLGDFRYTGEGWGLTTDGTYLYMSNGSERIEVIDPDGFRSVRTIEVCTDRTKVGSLNELEWIDGEIWANVYMTDQIVRIDPATGAVTGIVDLRGLLKTADKDIHTDVLNGIAWDASARRLFVTGKNWKKLFEIQLSKL
jgi:glutamine cyclotransferase